jgi:hypothetical protein
VIRACLHIEGWAESPADASRFCLAKAPPSGGAPAASRHAETRGDQCERLIIEECGYWLLGWSWRAFSFTRVKGPASGQSSTATQATVYR